MADFDNFMLHRCQREPQSQGMKVQLGGGYSFATDGAYPLIHLLRLKFTGYKWYTQADGKTLDYETNKNINNLGALYNFYKDKLQYKTFTYQDEVLGLINVRFDQPLIPPFGLKRGNGVVEDFEVQLIQVV